MKNAFVVYTLIEGKRWPHNWEGYNTYNTLKEADIACREICLDRGIRDVYYEDCSTGNDTSVFYGNFAKDEPWVCRIKSAKIEE